MKLSEVSTLAEEHPWATGGIVFGVGLLLLWWFGVFSGGSGSATSTSGTQTNLASAYYAAEAAQATAGTQLQMATVSATAQTQIATAQDNAAVAIAAAQGTTTQAVANSMYGSQTAIAENTNATAQVLGAQTAQAQIAQALVPLNIAALQEYGQQGPVLQTYDPSTGSFAAGIQSPGPAQLAAGGWTPTEIASFMGARYGVAT